jgi:SsrA-binding protein
MRIFNRRAKHDYHILQTLEAGVVLSGPEVKSVRLGKVNLVDAFARIQNNEVYLKNAYIYPYQGQHEQYDPRHDRKLLLHRNQIETLRGKISGSATTLIPLSIYEKNNFFKVELALAASKKKYDKKRAIKAKDEQRKLSQELKGF